MTAPAWQGWGAMSGPPERRVTEGRHGFPGAAPSAGGMGGHVGAPGADV